MRVLKLLGMLGLVLPIAGCGVSDKYISDKVLSHMKDTYNVGFDLVDFDYRKSGHYYQLSLQSDSTKGNKPTEVTYYSRKEVYDDFYQARFFSSIKEKYFSNLDFLGVNYYVSIDSFGDLFFSTNNYANYNEFLDSDAVDNTVGITIYVDGQIDTLLAEKELKSILDNTDLYYSLSIIQAKFWTLEDIAELEETHTHFFSSDNFMTGVHDYDSYLEINRFPWDES